MKFKFMKSQHGLPKLIQYMPCRTITSSLHPAPTRRVHTAHTLPGSELGRKLRKSFTSNTSAQRHPGSHPMHWHWLFRTNIPRRRHSLLPNEIHKRNFFGMGEIIGVLTNPLQTVQSLTESKRLLAEARREISESRERAQLRPKHTFSRLPGYFPRTGEVRALERALEGEPAFTVLFGASSVGKTALLREVLSRPSYHVLHFDLRIAGFADLASLYISLSLQMEQYFEEIAKGPLECGQGRDVKEVDKGWKEFEREALAFKHDRLDVERRISEAPAGSNASAVKTSDIARLMELFQSSLLKYWEFEPPSLSSAHTSSSDLQRPRRRQQQQPRQSTDDSERTHVEPNDVSHGSSSRKLKFPWFKRRSRDHGDAGVGRTSNLRGEDVLEKEGEAKEKGKEKERPPKKMPVLFFDEAHKLPALIQSTETMKCLLDSMLVLTKQDRLCHVIHATSDPFYQTWLRQLNVMQHCKIITVGDCSKAETRAFFRTRMLPRVPEQLQPGLDFEALYEAFGGKLAHWYDFVTDYVNSNGNLDIKQSSHFLQAHALLNLHIIHSSQASPPQGESPAENHASPNASTAGIHPRLGPASFKIYSPITQPQPPNNGSLHPSDANSTNTTPEFTAMQLLKVMSRLAQPNVAYLPYFVLCRELGVKAVDGMIKGRVLDLRWTECVTREGGIGGGDPDMNGPGGVNGIRHDMGPGPGSSGTAVELGDAPEPLYDDEVYEDAEGEIVNEVVGPKVVPTTPIMRYAMAEVVAEYEDEQSVSEYASLSDVDEY